MSSTYKIFKNYFRLKIIKEVYDERISKKATRGIDRIGIKKFNEIKKGEFKVIYKKCNTGTYRFSPYVEKLQSKGRNKKPRLISVSTIRDRIVLSILKEILHEIFPESVYRKLPNNYIKEIKEFYETTSSKHLCYFKTDIKSFYDTIDHDILIGIIKSRVKSKKLINLIKSSLKTPTVPINYKKKVKDKYKRIYGVPQGLSISNILANIYLKEVDVKLQSIGAKYIRYVDDILIFIDENDTSNVEGEVRQILLEYHLSLNESKTECKLSDFDFEYLGYLISRSKTSIKEANVERFITSVAAKFSSYLHNTDERIKKYPWLNKDIQQTVFIEDLNEKITGSLNEKRRYGWLFYFIEITDISLLHKLDKIIRNFFIRLNDFGAKPPDELKKLSKAYYKAKYDPRGGYIHNYDNYETIAAKMKYLGDRGYINPEKRYKKEDIDIIFNRIKRKRLTDLELDIGITS
ncbi:MAG: reverse transcriptase domain-containing protein [Thermodesulfobacteriota bacterium]